MRYKLLISFIIVCMVFTTGCAKESAVLSEVIPENKESDRPVEIIKEDYISQDMEVLMDNILNDLELAIIENSPMEYDTNWFKDKYSDRTEKEILDVIEFCGEFNYVKENQNQDNLMLLLDNFIIVMESLVDSEFNINNNGGENAETIPIEI